jgi:hypothetical protein
MNSTVSRVTNSTHSLTSVDLVSHMQLEKILRARQSMTWTDAETICLHACMHALQHTGINCDLSVTRLCGLH